MSIFGENKKKTSFVNIDFILHHMYIYSLIITSFGINSVYASEKKIGVHFRCPVVCPI